MNINKLLITIASLCLVACTTLPAHDQSTEPETHNERQTYNNSKKKYSKAVTQAIEEMNNDKDEPETIDKTQRLRIVSYNVENLFDTEDDPKTDDEEFTPGSEKNWTKDKYKIKLANTAKAIAAAGNGKTPAIVGLCEIENKGVLTDLINKTQLKQHNYKIIHKDSPDHRGIDVALLYNDDAVKVIEHKYYTVALGQGKTTRDILWAKLRLPNNDVVNILVNHWPSMAEGKEQSEPKRIKAAKVAKRICDSLMAKNKDVNIILMGDFNSEANRPALAQVLNVKNTIGNNSSELYNLMARYANNRNLGTHKYQGSWDVLDQVIVSGHLLKRDSKTFTVPTGAHICHSKFLLSQGGNGYYSPKRSFKGDRFTQGYSDHLPVMLDLYLIGTEN